MTDNENAQNEPEVAGQWAGVKGENLDPDTEQAEVEGQGIGSGHKNDEPDAAAADRESFGHGEVEGQWIGVKRNDEPEGEPSERDWGKGTY